MRRFTLLSLMFLTFGIPAVAQRDLRYLRGWIGKYPVSTPAEPYQNIYQTRPLHRRLVKLLARKNYNRLLNDYYVMGPVKLAGDYIIVDRCERHNCDESASFLA